MDKLAFYKEEIYKQASQKRENKDDIKRDNDTETRLWRDRVKPEVIRNVKTLPSSIGGGVAAGLGAGLLLKNNKKIDPGLAQTLTMGSTAAGSGLGSLISHNKQSKKELKRLSDKYLDKEPTKKDKNITTARTLVTRGLASSAPPAALAASFIATPEAIVQKKRRDAMREKMQKQAALKRDNDRETRV